MIGGPIIMRLSVDPAFRRALKEAPNSMRRRIGATLGDAMGIMTEAVRTEIATQGEVRSGRMLRGTRARVRNTPSGDWEGRLRVRRFYGRFRNAGTTMVVGPKPIRFPIGDVAEITEIGGRQLRRSRYAMLNARWVTLRPGHVIIQRGTRFFDRPVETRQRRVLDMFKNALAEVLKSEFGR